MPALRGGKETRVKTIQEEWEEFARRLYPDGMSNEQARQLQRAFFGGATVTLCQMGEAAERLPEEEAAAHLGSLLKECHAFAARSSVEAYLKGERPTGRREG